MEAAAAADSSPIATSTLTTTTTTTTVNHPQNNGNVAPPPAAPPAAPPTPPATTTTTGDNDANRAAAPQRRPVVLPQQKVSGEEALTLGRQLGKKTIFVGLERNVTSTPETLALETAKDKFIQENVDKVGTHLHLTYPQCATIFWDGFFAQHGCNGEPGGGGRGGFLFCFKSIKIGKNWMDLQVWTVLVSDLDTSTTLQLEERLAAWIIAAMKREKAKKTSNPQRTSSPHTNNNSVNNTTNKVGTTNSVTDSRKKPRLTLENNKKDSSSNNNNTGFSLCVADQIVRQAEQKGQSVIFLGLKYPLLPATIRFYKLLTQEYSTSTQGMAKQPEKQPEKIIKTFCEQNGTRESDYVFVAKSRGAEDHDNSCSSGNNNTAAVAASRSKTTQKSLCGERGPFSFDVNWKALPHSSGSSSSSPRDVFILEQVKSLLQSNRKQLAWAREDDAKPAHQALWERIRKATTVSDFEGIYFDLEYMIQRVDQAQREWGDRWSWSVMWAKARHRAEGGWADVFEKDRKTCLLLLQYLYRRYEKDDDDPPGFNTLEIKNDVVKEFGTDKIMHILACYLPVDKANAFYVMRPYLGSQDPPGIPWYCKHHTSDELKASKVVKPPSGRGALNSRYFLLHKLCQEYRKTVGDDPVGDSLKDLLKPEMPPSNRNV